MPSEPSEISQSEPVGEVPSAEMGFATVDLDRERRTGFPEVVMGEGKTPEHIAEIAKADLRCVGDGAGYSVEP